MIQREAGSDGLQPTARCWTDAQVIEVLVRLEKHFLRDILGLRVVARQTGGRREDHILIGAHERYEFCRVLHCWRVSVCT
jgi:hypothetical protein